MRHYTTFIALVYAMCLSCATALVYTPIFTPCTFPTPLQQQMYASTCFAPGGLRYLCDVNKQLAHSPTSAIDAAYRRYQTYFSPRNRSSLVVVLVRQLESPSSTASLHLDSRYSCLFDNDCPFENDVISIISTNPRAFMKVYAWKLYERFFSPTECEEANILALVCTDGLINDPRKIAYVRLHTGNVLLRQKLGNIQSEFQNALIQGWPLHESVGQLIDDLGYSLQELASGRTRDHSMPRWARHVFFLCTALVIAALIFEWYIVRRKLGVQKSGAVKKITGGRSKTHLMF